MFKIGGNWQPFEKTDLRLRAEYVHQTIDIRRRSFPAASEALGSTPSPIASFAPMPTGLHAGSSGRSARRSISSSRGATPFRWGFDFTKPLQVEAAVAGRDRLVPPALRRRSAAAGRARTRSTGRPPEARRRQGPDPEAAGFRGFGGGGGGRFGGGGRAAG